MNHCNNVLNIFVRPSNLSLLRETINIEKIIKIGKEAHAKALQFLLEF